MIDFIYAPVSNIDVMIRTTHSTDAASGESIRVDVATFFSIVEIGNNSGTSGSSGSSGTSGTSGIDNTAWTSYSIAWYTSGSQPFLGNGTLTGRYKQIGKTVFLRVKFVGGTTTTYGSGDWRFSLPVTASTPDGVIFPCTMLDDGNNWYAGIVNGTYTGSATQSSIITTSSPSTAVTAATPFNWGSGDSLMFNGSYESV
jgi:hypothetical protein